MGHVRDRWTDPNPDGGRRTRNDRWGKGKRWQARWIENGREEVKAFDNKDAALAHLADQRSGTTRKPVSTVAVEQRIRLWEAGRLHYRQSTKAAVAGAISAIILPTLGDKLVTELDRETLQAAVTEWSQRWSPSRVRVAWSFVTSMLKQAEADELIERVPKGVILPRITREPLVPLTVAQVEQVAAAVPDRYRAMVVVGAASGLRSAELRGLTRDRVVGGVLVVDRQLVDADRLDPVFGPPKSAAGRRRVPVGQAAAAILDDHLARWGSDDLVFRTRLGSPVSRNTASDVWRAATQGMGLRSRSGWHELRHFHASMLIAGGMSPTAVAARLGHADASETLGTYAHLWPTDDARAVGIVEAELIGSSLLARSPDGHA